MIPKTKNKRLLRQVLSLVYLAGFFDGEGNITIARLGKYKRSTLRVSVVNTDMTVLRLIHGVYGGCFYLNDRCNRPAQCKVAGRLTWNGEAAYNLLCEMYPYLIVKAERAKLAIEFWETHVTLPKSLRCKLVNGNYFRTTETLKKDAWYKSQMNKLNKKGRLNVDRTAH